MGSVPPVVVEGTPYSNSEFRKWHIASFAIVPQCRNRVSQRLQDGDALRVLYSVHLAYRLAATGTRNLYRGTCLYSVTFSLILYRSQSAKSHTIRDPGRAC